MANVMLEFNVWKVPLVGMTLSQPCPVGAASTSRSQSHRLSSWRGGSVSSVSDWPVQTTPRVGGIFFEEVKKWEIAAMCGAMEHLPSRSFHWIMRTLTISFLTAFHNKTVSRIVKGHKGGKVRFKVWKKVFKRSSFKKKQLHIKIFCQCIYIWVEIFQKLKMLKNLKWL